MNQYIFIGIVVLTILINIILAFLRRKDITFSVYAADPNRHGWHVIAMTLTATIVGGGMFLVVGQIGYEAGTVGFIIGLVYLAGLAIVSSLTKKIRKMMDERKHETLIDMLGAIYNSRVVLQFCSVQLFMYTFLLAGQFVAMFYFAQFIGNAMGIIWIPWSLVALASISVFLYPIIGGLRKDIQTDIIQITLIIIASIIILIKLIGSGVLKSMWIQLPVSHIFGLGYGWTFIIGLILFLTPSFLVRIDIWQRIRTAKTERDSQFGFWAAGFLSLFFYFLFTAIGIWAYSMKLSDSEFVTLDLLYKEFNNPIMLGLIVGAFFAAVLSSTDTFINNVSLFITRLTFPKLWNERSGERKSKTLLFRSRMLAIIFTFVSIALGWLVANFVDLLIGAFSLILIYLPIILGLFVEKWQNSRAAFWSSNAGVLLFLFLFFLWNPKLAFAPAVIFSFVIFFIFILIQFLQKRKNTEPKMYINK